MRYLVQKRYNVDVTEYSCKEGTLGKPATLSSGLPDEIYDSLEELFGDIKYEFPWLEKGDCFFKLDTSMFEANFAMNDQYEEPTSKEMDDWEAEKINLYIAHIEFKVKVLEERDIEKEDVRGTGFITKR